MTSVATKLPATMRRFGLPMRSLTSPPNGTDTMVTQTARLTTKPASPTEAPRATRTPGPNASTVTRLALKHPQAKPALSERETSCQVSRAPGARTLGPPPAARGGSR